MTTDRDRQQHLWFHEFVSAAGIASPTNDASWLDGSAIGWLDGSVAGWLSGVITFGVFADGSTAVWADGTRVIYG